MEKRWKKETGHYQDFEQNRHYIPFSNNDVILKKGRGNIPLPSQQFSAAFLKPRP
jgi:hypothetical protein